MKNVMSSAVLVLAGVIGSYAQAASLSCYVETSQPISESSGYQDIQYGRVQPLPAKDIQPSQPGWRPTANFSATTSDGNFQLDVSVAQFQDNTFQMDFEITNLNTKSISQTVVTDIAPANLVNGNSLIPLQLPDPAKFPGGKISAGALQPAATGAYLTCKVIQ